MKRGFLRRAAVCLVILLNSRALIAQTNPVDLSFDPGAGANDLVESELVQPDGKILVCGIFTQFNGVARNYIARLNSDGSVDPTFSALPSYWVRYMALQSDGKIVIGGFFTSVAGVARNRVARLNSDGSLDTTFDPGTGCEGKVVPADDKDPFVFAILVQADGKIVLAGNFATYNSVPSSGIVRLNTDGSLDTSFQVGAGFNSWGRYLMQLPNNQVLATGWFTSYNNQSYNRMVILNSDGTPDTSFNPYFGDSTAIYAAVLLPNGQFIVGGHSINTLAPFTNEVARLNPDGTYDTSYKGSANDKVESIYLQPDGKIIIGGYFSLVDGIGRSGLARLNADGSLDDSFRAATDNFVWTLRGQTDGKVLACGGFYNVAGVPRVEVARLNIGPAVVSRMVFYNDSTFDGNNPGASTSDDAAIATDKSALLPGNTATFANYTSYSGGLNGIMVDIVGLTGAPTAADFTFRIGNSSNPAAWTLAPAPLSVTVRTGAGVGGSDRVTLIWADGVIAQEWLEVTAGSTPATGLAAPDRFYFGNAIGETGNSASDAKVDATDEIGVRNNQRTFADPAPLSFPFDFNRDGLVNATDEILARNNQTTFATALQLIQVP